MSKLRLVRRHMYKQANIIGFYDEMKKLPVLQQSKHSAMHASFNNSPGSLTSLSPSSPFSPLMGMHTMSPQQQAGSALESSQSPSSSATGRFSQLSPMLTPMRTSQYATLPTVYTQSPMRNSQALMSKDDYSGDGDGGGGGGRVSLVPSTSPTTSSPVMEYAAVYSDTEQGHRQSQSGQQSGQQPPAKPEKRLSMISRRLSQLVAPAQ